MTHDDDHEASASRYAVRVRVLLRSGREQEHGPFPLGFPALSRTAKGTVVLGDTGPFAVRVEPPDDDQLAGVEYVVRVPMGNFEHVIAPDSGRWFMNTMHVTGFWKYGRSAASRIGDVKTPLYIFTGADGGTAAAIGVVGGLVETDFELIEPESGRALNVHTRGVTVRFRRGAGAAPLHDGVLDATGALEERLYVPTAPSRASWVETLREFSEHTRTSAGEADRHDAAAFDPFWCSWVDWASDDINEEMVVENVRIGVDVGIRNFIIDDGWFGPGLDTGYSTPLNIGDWTPDPAKFPDMPRLVRRIGELGGRAIIWCAPHAVGPAARCRPERLSLLQADESGEPVIGETQFASLCFRSPAAREVMVEICRGLAVDYGFGGAKYDLFNWIPDVRCRSPFHEHDTVSMIDGLQRMLRDADVAVRRVQPDYVVELKQNYGTPLLSAYGSCMRAGDAPFDPRTNFLRTMHVQAYTPNALNDYQTFAPGDGPREAAVAVITMLAAGIPAYGSDLARQPPETRDVLRWHHRLYTEKRAAFTGHRRPDDAALTSVRASGPEHDVVMLTGSASSVAITRPSTILNGGRNDVLLLTGVPDDATLCIRDIDGQRLHEMAAKAGTTTVHVPIGGSVEVQAAAR